MLGTELNGLFQIVAKISNMPFDRHYSIPIFVGDNYPDSVIGMLFRLVHCNSRRDKPVKDGINKVIRLPQLTRNFSQAFTFFDLRNAPKMTIAGARDQAR